MNSKMKKFKKDMFVQTKNLKNAAENSIQSSSFIDPSHYMVDGEFKFTIPPEAPVFEPSPEEFLDPLAYILKIKPIAEKIGICKIKPPPEWDPPFAVDVDSFKFTPRVQKLHELEGNTRIKLYFLDRLATFWNFQGVQIRIPAINEKTVDMYSLYTIVKMEGGFDVVNMEKKWGKVATRMGYANEKTVISALKTNYKRLLLPFEMFEKSINLAKFKTDEKIESTSDTSSNSSNCGSPMKQTAECGSNNSNKRRTRSNYTENDTEILVSETFKDPLMQDKNKELQRLTFYGPGPKILGSNKRKLDKFISSSSQIMEDCTGYACVICKSGETDDNIILCDGCEDSYHTYCLIPALSTPSKGKWRCHKCIWTVINKTHDAFGFEQSDREYTLQQFGEMADQFKSNYFNMPVHLVPTDRVEHEYWRIMSSLDSTVSVEYGADLHSMDHGSGFPTQVKLEECGDESNYYKRYVESSWNLNNIPVLEGSVLGYIDADISGMKIPWMYVGMCFSTFCWHNEDHWSYSINYLHWGEPKTWYGVPGSKAEEFQKVMQQTAPDLFYTQPDLLHQLVTILNPNILMDKGIPVYHINQMAGEFVLTFPRSYHAGFNHGYNFAEAVNFAPADWIPIGRMCIDDYSSLHRMCVFSHDELICKIASFEGNLNSTLITAACEDTKKMFDTENKQRKALLEWGVVNAEKVNFELLADDARQCIECNTTCFLSAVKCKCNPDKLSCLRHYQNMCSNCAPLDHTLKYRFTLDELMLILTNLKEKYNSVDVWAAKVHDALDLNTPRTITLSGLKDLLNEAIDKNFPETSPLGLLSTAINSVEKALAANINKILSQKFILPTRIKLKEIEGYYDELKCIPCVLPQEIPVAEFLDFIKEFKNKVTIIINDDRNEWNVRDIERILEEVNFPNIDIPEVNTLRKFLTAQQWLETCNQLIGSKTDATEDEIDKLLSSGKNLLQFPMVAENIKRIAELKRKIIELRHLAEMYLTTVVTSTLKPTMDDLQRLVNEMNSLNVTFTERGKIMRLIKTASEWQKAAVDLLASCKSCPPYLYRIEDMVEKGQSSPVNFEEVGKLQAMIASAYTWKHCVKKMFVKETSKLSLLEIVMPRIFRKYAYFCRDQSFDKKFFLDVTLNGIDDTENIMGQIEDAEKREMELIVSLRVKNVTKQLYRSSARYCLCNSSFSADMIECILCRGLFHASCLNVKNDNSDSRSNNMSKILCSVCQRGKRPSLENAVRELKNLKLLKVQLFEGTALIRLIDRATTWKTEITNLINSDNALKKAFFKLQESHSNDVIIRLTIDETIRNKLQDFLMRGNLIELGISETDIVWKLLKYSQPPLTDSSADQQRLEFIKRELSCEETFFQNEMLEIISIQKHKKRRIVSTTKNSNNNNNIDGSSNVVSSGKSFEKSANCSSDHYRGNNNMAAAAAGNINKIKPKIKSTRKMTSNKINYKKTIHDNKDTSFNDEEDDNGKPCHMKNCLQPTEDHVDWVECDCCKKWLHMICAGVTRLQVESQTEFICDECLQLKRSLPGVQVLTSKSRNNNDNLLDDSDDDVICID